MFHFSRQSPTTVLRGIKDFQTLMAAGFGGLVSRRVAIQPDSPGFVNLETSLQISSTGRPVVAYQRTGGATPGLSIDVWVAICGDPECGSMNVKLLHSQQSAVIGKMPSLQLTSADAPVVAWASSNFDVSIAICADWNCTDCTFASIAFASNWGAVTDPDSGLIFFLAP